MKIGIASADYLHPDRSHDGKEYWGGAGWARLGQYVPYLRAAGHEVIVGTLWDHVDGAAVEDSLNKKLVLPDVVILQRIMHAGVARTTKCGRSNGQIIIHDIDDWYWGLDPNNEAWRATNPKFNAKENTTFYSANVAASSYVITSTPYLAQRIHEKWRVPTHILPNTVDVGRFKVVTQSDIPVLGWVGSTAHRSGDVEQVRGIFPQFLRDGKIKLMHAGHNPAAASFSELIDIDPDLISTTPLRYAHEYPEMLTMDIGIVPLRDIPFNHAKSDIKGLEYASAGIPFIASALPSYRSLFETWGTGMFLAKRPNDWIKATNKLLDKQLRIDYQQALRELVWQRDIANGASALIQLLEAMR